MPRSNSSTQNIIKQDKPANIKQIPGSRVTSPRVPPPPQISTLPSSNSYGSGFVDSLVSGFGFGMGSSLARKVLEPKISPEPQNTNLNMSTQSFQPITPDNIFDKYMECLQRNEPTDNCEMLLQISC